MIVLLVATGALALLCDYMRIRMQRAAVVHRVPMHAPAFAAAREPRYSDIAPTLVPEVEVPEMEVPEAQKSMRAARLAAALRQPRRLVSADVLAVIERNPQDEAASQHTASPSQKKSKMSHAS